MTTEQIFYILVVAIAAPDGHRYKVSRDNHHLVPRLAHDALLDELLYSRAHVPIVQVERLRNVPHRRLPELHGNLLVHAVEQAAATQEQRPLVALDGHEVGGVD